VIVALALCGPLAAHADFEGAMRDYNAGRYDAAHAQFLALAELGDCSSQFNLGAMALKGQGDRRTPRAASAGCRRPWATAASSSSATSSPHSPQG